MKKDVKPGLPYMGSKRTIADKIVKHIVENNPECKYVYDLFGGGAAISLQFLKHKQIERIVYNELNTGITELLKDLLQNGVTDKYYQWVSRETFEAHKNDNDWFGGLCKTIWSFGNNQSSYLFGKDVEEYKRNFHTVVINGEDRLNEMADYCMQYVKSEYDIQQSLVLTMPVETDYQKRRLNIRKQLNVFEKNCKLKQVRALQQLERLQQLQQLERLQQLESFDIEQLQQLQQLQKIDKCESLIRIDSLSKLRIDNMSYSDVVIDTPINETIIYIDPPYKDTYEYEEKVNHDLLNEYIKNSPYKIYVSSYKSDLPCVLYISKRCTMSQTKNNSVLEKLFCNRNEK